jgi:hypothetical protein
MGKQAHIIPTLASTRVHVERGMNVHVESFLLATEAATALVRMMLVAQTKPPRAKMPIKLIFWARGSWSFRISQIGRRRTRGLSQ